MNLFSLLHRDTNPQRKIMLSDTYGGPIDPTQRPDADAILCTHFRSQTFDAANYKFDTFGNEAATHHILELIVGLHDQIDNCSHLSKREKRRFRRMGTGVLINAAPRTEASAKNGENFVVADLRGNIRVVATPLSELSPVKEDVERLRIVPNHANGLWSDVEQFRSSYAGLLLDEQFAKRFPLQEADPSCIPDPQEHWRLSYVDRFGNLITDVRDPALQLQKMQDLQTWSKGFRIQIGDCVRDDLTLTSSLTDATPGRIVGYGNGNLDFVRKWAPLDTPHQKIELSAYHQFGKPLIGSPISVHPLHTA
jgi:hypothetical protein